MNFLLALLRKTAVQAPATQLSPDPQIKKQPTAFKPHKARTLKNYSSLTGAEFCLKILKQVLQQDLIVTTEK